ncbi:proline--tRNA ligase [Acetobacter peroxydans]|uniref:Proline--tRNA ligase n=1 Tax=Acetobacter peroxydans TaxID=104098 RepID=A0A4Y3TPK1_9PROT|nr:proline--tRNA ligase [Acetobacter peroxydans]NHO15662.1 proline--tRNA ligase [Acetobacter peroxydans]GBR32713.1 prolyl-tRNA synthetase [Acetobacter peroxydans NBRC 13755]GBR44777.1 prolyl-tRNA synthetase [Acetobacter peroxydans]GEB84931.1 proline--tRNA ligase [Acetobacter peroxydans]
MRLSRSFIPTLKENPAEAQIVSHRLMLRAGLIRQTASGIYAWLPAGLRVLRNISQIVREEQDRIDAQEVLMPTLQSADLWRRSGRYDAYGPEMLRIQDRHKRELLYGPTNEEMITDLFGQSVKSYKELPQALYHIQWKFRDEVRPRFGVMRGREFLMKDAYSFDVDYAGAVATYRRMLLSYLRTFQRLGVQAVPMRADTGPIGGELSHEFLILAPTGESGVYYDAALEEQDWLDEPVDVNSHEALEAFFNRVTAPYAATDEMHDTAAWENVPVERRREGRGVEVGHIFYFGTKYTEAMDISVVGPDGNKLYPEMGSYGIGVSRLAGAIIEASHDENGIIWPDSIAPFKAAILNLKSGDELCDALCERIYAAAPESFLYDDRPERAGVKFADADLMGHPWQIVVGPRGAKAGLVELKRRATGDRQELAVDDALALVLAG